MGVEGVDFEPMPPDLSLSKSFRLSDEVGVVAAGEERAEGLEGEEGLWMPRGRNGEAGSALC